MRVIIFLMLLSLASCIKSYHNKGYVFDEKKFTEIKEHKTSSDEVLEIMGSPTTTSDFANIWYFISRNTENYAFIENKVVDQKIVAIEFDKQNIVKSKQIYNDKDLKQIQILNDYTKSRGDDTGVMKDFFGNFGKYNVDRLSPTK